MSLELLLKKGLALLGWALLFGGGASADASPSSCARLAGGDAATAGSLRYRISWQQTGEVLVASGEGARALIVRHLQQSTGVVLAESVATGLLPVPGSGGEALEQLCLLPEPDGFTLFVSYHLRNRTEHYWLSFAQPPCDPARPSTCVVRLSRYRHERLGEAARLLGGLVADYRSGQARWLGDEPGVPGAAVVPVRLRHGLAPALTGIGSVFDFSPELDLPRLH